MLVKMRKMIGGLTNLTLMIAGITQYLTQPYIYQELLTRMSNKAPGNVLPIVPIEVFTTGSRTALGAQRTGPIEAAERCFEESSTAVVWLFGVQMMNSLLSRTIAGRQKAGRLPFANVDADWSKGFLRQFLPGEKKASLLLSPLEAFSPNYKTLQSGLGIKAVQFALAVGVPLYLCGWAIPSIKNAITNYLIVNHPKLLANQGDLDSSHNHPPLNPGLRPISDHANGNLRLAGRSPETPQSIALNQPPQGFSMAPSFAATTPVAPNVPIRLSPSHQWMQAQRNSPGNPQPPRFGSWATSAMSALGWLGHAVDNTAYGSVLAVDFGVAGGRALAEAPRSPIGSIEVLVRDVGSLIFYLWSAPFVMAAASKLLDKRFGTALGLDQQIVTHMNQAFQDRMGSGMVDPARAQQILRGVTLPNEAAFSQQLRQTLTTVDANALTRQFEQELVALAQPGEEVAYRQLAQRIQRQLPATTHYTPEILTDTLNRIWSSSGTLGASGGALTQAEQFHASTALKMAYHHHVGATRTAVNGILAPVLNGTDRVMASGLVTRLDDMALRSQDRSLALLLRRGLNVVHAHNGQHYRPEMVAADELARLMEQSVLEGRPVRTVIQDSLGDVVKALETQGLPMIHGRRGTQDIQRLTQLVTDVKGALANPTLQGLDGAVLEELVERLKSAGRTGPRWLRWIQGPGLGRVAADVERLIPFVPKATPGQALTPLTQLIPNQLEQTLAGLVQRVAHHAPASQLLANYGQQVRAVLQGTTNTMGLAVDHQSPASMQWLDQQLNRLLKGGMMHDDTLWRRALRTLRRIPTTAESFFDPAELTKIAQPMDNYLTLMERRLTQPMAVSEVATSLANLARRNNVMRYSSWGVALAVSMLGIGVLIPKLTYWVTRQITGKDDSPGIMAMAERLRAKARMH